MLPSSYSCPRCKCHALYRARPRWFDLPMTVLGLEPIRCWTCNRRFHLRLPKGKKTVQPSRQPGADQEKPLDSKEAA